MKWYLFLPLALASSLAIESPSLFLPVPLSTYIIYGSIAIALVLTAGLMSGLTVGMMGISELELELKMTIGSPEEKALARKLLPIVHQHHLLLVTLLLANAVAAEALPIILCHIVTEPVAIVISTAFILLFGEIFPMALCTGPDQMKIAARCALIVRIAICVFFPITWPFSLLLDVFFKEKREETEEEESRLLGNAEVRSLPSNEYALSDVQLRIIHSAIRSREETVSQRMVPLSLIRCLSSDAPLDFSTLQSIRKLGFSRIPVFKGELFIGILLTKQLLAVSPSDNLTIETANVRMEPFVVTTPGESILNLLHLFRSKQTHIALISKNVTLTQPLETTRFVHEFQSEMILGLVTMESVLSHLIKISDFHEKAVGVMQRSIDRMSRTASSVKKGFGHLHFLNPSAGVLFYGQQRGMRAQSLCPALSPSIKPLPEEKDASSTS